MIKFENTEVVGWEHAIRGMRNPMNSWDKSDSVYCSNEHCNKNCPFDNEPEKCMNFNQDDLIIGNNDLDLMKRLIKAGTVHRKFMRMIAVYVDITAPLYWWKEFDTYKVGTVANSCSTMHKIQAKEFTIDDFSHEHLLWYTGDELKNVPDLKQYQVPKEVLYFIIKTLNYYRELFLETKDKKYWWQMIQLLPSSYNQKRTVMLNYEVLANIYQPDSRLHHKLDEWNVDCEGSFCKWIESLPYSELITEAVKKEA